MKKTEQLVWVIYDIVSDKTRRHVIKVLKKAGLYRVQKSVFLGSLERNRLDELHIEIEEMIQMKKDSVYIFPLCEQDFKKVILLGKGFDKKLVTDEVKALFF
ncbi:MAG: CRISPR-associated endonuclease Cas2 [Candidatus Marinimicrobia bacterium]|nr:CRISPR-associated endonuclease Cas2 [Candidatus Neomarinimicrobiota bacterium]